MAQNDDVYIPVVPSDPDGKPSLHALNAIVRYIFQALHYLEGRSGEVGIRDGMQVDGDVTIAGPAAVRMDGGVYTPAADAAAGFTILTEGSRLMAGSNEGIRTATVNLFDTNTTNTDNALLMLDVVQSENPTGGLIKKTGIHVKAYTMPDNGADSSAILVNQTGGGSGISCYKTSNLLRPTGATNYFDSPQGAMEVGTLDGSHAGLFISGLFGSTVNGDAIVARVDNPTNTAAAIRALPGNGTFDTRYAWYIGGRSGVGLEVCCGTAWQRFNGETAITGLRTKIRTVSADTTPAETDHTLIVDSSGGVRTINLPTAASSYDSTTGAGRIYYVKRVGANNVVLDANGVEDIDGLGTYTLSVTLAAVGIQSTGIGWRVIATA